MPRAGGARRKGPRDEAERQHAENDGNLESSAPNRKNMHESSTSGADQRSRERALSRPAKRGRRAPPP